MPDRKSIGEFRTGDRILVQTPRGWRTGLYVRLKADGMHLVRPEGSTDHQPVAVADDQIRRITND
jgi:hypothetical protein